MQEYDRIDIAKFLKCGLHHFETLSHIDKDILNRLLHRRGKYFTYIYKNITTGCLNISMDRNTIYLDIDFMNGRLEHLLMQLFGRFKSRNYIVTSKEYDVQMPGIGSVVIDNEICYFRFKKTPSLYLGVCRNMHIYIYNCTGVVKDNFVRQGVVTIDKDIMYIYFDCPIVYDRMSYDDCYVKLNWIDCDMGAIKYIPRWNKLEIGIGRDEKHRTIQIGKRYNNQVRTYLAFKLGDTSKHKGNCAAFSYFGNNVLTILNGKASIIQQYWRKCISDPKHKLCQKRLQREFDQLSLDPNIFI